MTAESGKNSRKLASRTPEEMSPSVSLRAEKASQASLRSAPKPTLEGPPQSQPPFKKPKLDASSFTVKEPAVEGRGLSCKNANFNSGSISSGAEIMDVQTDGANIEDSAFSARDCSTCGDVGFQAELFKCTKCCFRLQHTYCSNSYNPRKRWFIGLCNWCEAEVAASSSPRPKVALGQGSSKRDSPWRSTGKMERSNAVECLLGAALRLPSAGFSSVEDLVQVEPNATALARRRKPPSFDSVEKARRSGPSGDINAKSSERSAIVAAAAAAAAVKEEASPPLRREGPRSPSSSVDDGERRSPVSGAEPIPATKVKKSPGATSGDGSSERVPSPKSPGGGRESCKRARSEGGHGNCGDERSSRAKGEDAPAKRRASSCDSAEKQSSTSTTTSTNEAAGAATAVDKAAKNSLSPIPGPLQARVSGTRSPRSPAVAVRATMPEERTVVEVTSLDSATRTKRSSSSVEHFQRTRSGTGPRTESKENNASRNARSAVAGSSPRPRDLSSLPGADVKPQQHAHRSVETGEKLKKLPSFLSVEKPAAIRPIRDCDEVAENFKGGAAGGGSDGSISFERRPQQQQQQRQQLQKGGGVGGGNRKDFSPPPRISPSSKQLTASLSGGRHHHVRTSHIVGKSANSPASRTGSVTDERSQKKHHSKDCSTKQLRRSSSKMTGFHNYKSLSDILC